MKATAARGAAGALVYRVASNCAPTGMKLALELAQAEQILIARRVLPAKAHYIARANAGVEA